MPTTTTMLLLQYYICAFCLSFSVQFNFIFSCNFQHDEVRAGKKGTYLSYTSVIRQQNGKIRWCVHWFLQNYNVFFTHFIKTVITVSNSIALFVLFCFALFSSYCSLLFAAQLKYGINGCSFISPLSLFSFLQSKMTAATAVNIWMHLARNECRFFFKCNWKRIG